MTAPRWTKGPWTWVDGNREEDLASLIGDDGNEVCNFGNSETYYPTQGEEPSEADKALIAAAPEMAEALRYAHEWMLTEGHVCDKCPAVLALARARGEG